MFQEAQLYTEHQETASNLNTMRFQFSDVLVLEREHQVPVANVQGKECGQVCAGGMMEDRRGKNEKVYLLESKEVCRERCECVWIAQPKTPLSQDVWW